MQVTFLDLMLAIAAVIGIFIVSLALALANKNLMEKIRRLK